MKKVCLVLMLFSGFFLSASFAMTTEACKYEIQQQYNDANYDKVINLLNNECSSLLSSDVWFANAYLGASYRGKAWPLQVFGFQDYLKLQEYDFFIGQSSIGYFESSLDHFRIAISKQPYDCISGYEQLDAWQQSVCKGHALSQFGYSTLQLYLAIVADLEDYVSIGGTTIDQSAMLQYYLAHPSSVNMLKTLLGQITDNRWLYTKTETEIDSLLKLSARSIEYATGYYNFLKTTPNVLPGFIQQAEYYMELGEAFGQISVVFDLNAALEEANSVKACVDSPQLISDFPYANDPLAVAENGCSVPDDMRMNYFGAYDAEKFFIGSYGFDKQCNVHDRCYFSVGSLDAKKCNEALPILLGRSCLVYSVENANDSLDLATQHFQKCMSTVNMMLISVIFAEEKVHQDAQRCQVKYEESRFNAILPSILMLINN